MPYDDDPYWGGLYKTKPKKPVKTEPVAENKPVAPRSPENGTEAAGKDEKAYRAQNPSPLLIEWLRVRGLAVK